jgi:hypothetical protein
MFYQRLIATLIASALLFVCPSRISSAPPVANCEKVCKEVNYVKQCIAGVAGFCHLTVPKSCIRCNATANSLCLPGGDPNKSCTKTPDVLVQKWVVACVDDGCPCKVGFVNYLWAESITPPPNGQPVPPSEDLYECK